MPEKILFDGSTKTCRIGDMFRPVFEHPLDRVLTALSQGFGDGIGGLPDRMVPCESPEAVYRPATDTLATVTRAIRSGSALSSTHVSLSGGQSRHEVVPFALVDDGLRWHVRAFDRKSSEFRGFVLTRIKRASAVKKDGPCPEELQDHDIQWKRAVELELIAHPVGPHPDVSALDYPMENGVLQRRARAALAGYVLRRWNSDCSPDHSLHGPEYRRWLRDPLSLCGVGSATLALGYVPPAAKG